MGGCVYIYICYEGLYLAVVLALLVRHKQDNFVAVGNEGSSSSLAGSHVWEDSGNPQRQKPLAHVASAQAGKLEHMVLQLTLVRRYLHRVTDFCTSGSRDLLKGA